MLPPPTPIEQGQTLPQISSPTPIFYELRIPKEAEEWLKTLSPDTFANYERIQMNWNRPLTQFSITLIRDQDLKGALAEISAQPKTTALLGYEVAWVLYIWIFRAWRLQKASTVLTRIWTQAWIAVLAWIGILGLIPAIVWGDAYRIAVFQVLKAVAKHFFV